MFAMIRNLLAAAAVAVFAAGPVVADALPVPTGEIVLTVTGDIQVKNQGDSAVFDAEMLKALGEVTYDTSTPWTDGVQSFTGVSLHRLMEVLGVTEGSLKATAINDYAIDIPVSDAV
ncbi:MAG: oxidoreductase, partial [Rhodobacterales bacterium]